MFDASRARAESACRKATAPKGCRASKQAKLHAKQVSNPQSGVPRVQAGKHFAKWNQWSLVRSRLSGAGVLGHWITDTIMRSRG